MSQLKEKNDYKKAYLRGNINAREFLLYTLNQKQVSPKILRGQQIADKYSQKNEKS